jgi:hypothetical protein
MNSTIRDDDSERRKRKLVERVDSILKSDRPLIRSKGTPEQERAVDRVNAWLNDDDTTTERAPQIHRKRIPTRKTERITSTGVLLRLVVDNN